MKIIWFIRIVAIRRSATLLLVFSLIWPIASSVRSEITAVDTIIRTPAGSGFFGFANDEALATVQLSSGDHTVEVKYDSATAGMFGSSVRVGFRRPLPENSIEEAAQVDGATPFQAFIRVLLPMAVPILAVVFVLSFITAIVDYPIASTLQGIYDRVRRQPKRDVTRPGSGQAKRRLPAAKASGSRRASDTRTWQPRPSWPSPRLPSGS